MVKGAVCKTVITSSILVGSFPLSLRHASLSTAMIFRNFTFRPLRKQDREDSLMRTIFIGLLTCLALISLGQPSRADLDSYLSKPEPVYKWEKTGEKKLDGGAVIDLHLVSQTWQGGVWQHRLVIFRPENPVRTDFCTLFNTGGNGSDSEMTLGMTAAKITGMPFAILYNIPNQPLYDGKTEDVLVAYTWQKYMETGDDTWPLHFPMAKAVLKAMDAIQAYTKEAGQPEINGFVVAGASKRGWTTWLAGASRDKRIKGIAPMVIDTLNVAAQIPHQLAAYGKPSEKVQDYTATGMLEKLNTPAGKRLMALEDPYSYRDRLTMPKLIILGTNDRYWSQDSLNLYWDDLKGPKWVLYNSNAGHALEGLDTQFRVLNAVGAFARAVAGGIPLPKPTWAYAQNDNVSSLTVHSDLPIKSAKLWHAHATTQDLRDAKWSSEPMTPINGVDPAQAVVGSQALPTEGYTATYAELTYTQNGKSFSLTTQIAILSPKK
ncbi:MAG: PhoPQ-activated pathogenicity-related protein [Chthonomonadaceae bacterium]|nr:PhoPQ-activated pathogenicity-related protein [Chthonomonadaceae bacterium]